MKTTTLGLSLMAVLFGGGVAIAQTVDPDYAQQQQTYQAQQQQYQDAQGRYQHQQSVYQGRRADYEAARAAYDADHGQGAFFHYYSDHPDEYDRLYGPDAYERDFPPR